eukprot:4542527-Amphidinium_carterae.1
MTVDRYIPYLNDTPEITTPAEVHSGRTREPEDDLFLVDSEVNEAVNIIPDVQNFKCQTMITGTLFRKGTSSNVTKR